jgi:hypothetical protein
LTALVDVVPEPAEQHGGEELILMTAWRQEAALAPISAYSSSRVARPEGVPTAAVRVAEADAVTTA